MSIIRNGPGTETGALRQQEGERGGDRTRGRADAGSVEAFREMMAQQRAAGHEGLPRPAQVAQDARGDAAHPQAGQDLRDPARGSADVLPPPESAALWQAQHMATQAPALATHAPPAAANPAALAQMLERHVRQLAVSEGGALHGEGQVLLRLDESTLPGTDLMLTRTTDGWLLQAEVRSADSFDAIRQAAGQLGERFAERGLGNLVVEPRYHG